MDKMDPRDGLQSLAGEYLPFKLGDGFYGIPFLRVQEVIKAMKAAYILTEPPFTQGVIDLRGRIIPVISLRLKVGLRPIPETDRTCIIITQVSKGRGSITVGLEVDEIAEVTGLTEGQLSNTLPKGADVDSYFIIGMARLGDKMLVLLDIDKLFSSSPKPQTASG
jgi:purine-binding chemotaxis protein CheW